MTAPVTSPLRYVLSATALTVTTTLRLAVVADDKGGHLEPEVLVTLASPARFAPIGSVRPVMVIPGTPGWTVAGCLRRSFDKAHRRTAALAADLSARAEQFLAGLRMGEDPTEVATIGAALEVVHRELAAADRMRREWIAGQGFDVRSATWDLSVDDLLPVEGTPRTLPAEVPLPTELAQTLAAEYGVVVVLASTGPDGTAAGAASVAVYRRPPAELPDSAVAAVDDVWRRDDILSHLQLGEATQPAATVAAVPAQRAGEPAWASAAHDATGASPEAALAAAETARTQLELLQGSDEYARLAATHHRAEELVALEHEARLADGRARRP